MRGLIKGSTVDEKFASVEQTLLTTQRKLIERHKIALSPIVLCSYQRTMFDDESIGTILTPVEGLLVRVCVHVVYSGEWPINCRLEHVRPILGTTLVRELTLDKPDFAIDVSDEVSAGDMFRVFSSPLYGLFDIAIAIMLKPKVDQQAVLIQLKNLPVNGIEAGGER